MAKTFTGRSRIRKSFGRIAEVAPMPNLIEVQKTSYDHFLQKEADPDERGKWGLEAVFDSVSRSAIFPAARCWNMSATNSKNRNSMSRSASSGA